MFRLGLVTLALAATPLRLLCAQEVRCNYATRYYCEENGCTSVSPEGEYLLIPDPRELRLAGIRNPPGVRPRSDEPFVQLRRCDAGGCMAVHVTVSQMGSLLNVWTIDGSYSFKFVRLPVRRLGLEAGQFVEVQTLMLGTFISYGSCPWDRR